jgi:hypothetical protein
VRSPVRSYGGDGKSLVWVMLCIISILPKGLSVIPRCLVRSFNIISPLSKKKAHDIIRSISDSSFIQGPICDSRSVKGLSEILDLCKVLSVMQDSGKGPHNSRFM